MTDQELKDFMAETARMIRDLRTSQRESYAEAERERRALRESLRESHAKTEREQRKTDKQLKELGKQIGGLGEKFGTFTEGMAFPSMKKILYERFGIINTAVRYRAGDERRSRELDVFGFTNTDRDVAVVVEVKSKLREDGLQQMLALMKELPDLLPNHRDKKLYGILAFVDASEELQEKALAEGLFIAQISGDTFHLTVPDDFEPRSFQKPELVN